MAGKEKQLDDLGVLQIALEFRAPPERTPRSRAPTAP